MRKTSGKKTPIFRLLTLALHCRPVEFEVLDVRLPREIEGIANKRNRSQRGIDPDICHHAKHRRLGNSRRAELERSARLRSTLRRHRQIRGSDR